ncbi:MAG: hypothetical protein WKF34_08925 [Pyrinomonadaceae bacterium]
MGLLLMLMTIGGLIVAAIILITAFITKRSWLAKFAVGGVAIWFVFYAVMLLGTSLLSTEKTLAMSEPKAFCGFYLDCHVHTAVESVRTVKTIGERTARGMFYVVAVRVSSDARAVPLGLTKPFANVVDDKGHHHHRDIEAELSLAPQPDFADMVGAGESFVKEIVFDLPAGAHNPRLDIREGFGIDHMLEAVLMSDEDSILHRRNYFTLTEQTVTSSVK